MPDVLTIREAAARLRISVDVAYDLARAGDLPGVLPKIGGQWRVSRAALERFLDGEPEGDQ